jgi:hypothetical protein
MARAKPKVPAAAPAIVPATAEAVYDHWEVQDISIFDNGSIVTGYVRWRRCRYIPTQINGETREVREFAPDTVVDAVAQLSLDNFDGLIEDDVDFGAGRDLFMAAAVRRAKRFGILK